MRSITRGLLLLSTIGLASCGEVVAPSAERAQELRAPAGQPDAGTNVEGFYWLPPMVPDPGPFTGVFDGGRSLVVRVVCTSASGPGCPVTAQFDAATPGAGQLRVDPEEEAYIANWHTPEALELGGGRYRLEVLEGGAVIGQAPLWVVARRQDLRSMTAGHVGLVRGQPFLIKFRVEEDGAPPPPPPPPPPLPPSCVDCLEVVPGAILLPGLGAQVQLQAFLVDQAGQRTPVTPTWSSSQTAHVVVTTSGIAIAASDAGSSQVTATAGGRTSAPVLAVVARPIDGVVLVPDAEIVTTMDPVDATAPFGPGWRYRAQLRSVTVGVGDLLVGTGQLPLAGRVVGVTGAAGGASDLVLEIVPVSQLFTTFAVQAELALGDGFEVADDASTFGAAAGAAPRFAAPAIQASDEAKIEFTAGPFKCELKGGVGLSNPINLDNYSFSITPDLNMAIDMRLDGFHSVLFTGSIAPQLVVNPVTNTALQAGLECKKLVKIVPVPVLGLISVFFGARVALGVGFGAEVSAPFGGIGVDLFATGSATVTAGFDRAAPSGLVGGATGSMDGYLKPVLPAFNWDNVIGRVSAGLSGFGWAEFRVGGPIEETQFTIVGAKLGLKQDATLASMQNQADDPAFANSFKLEAFVEAESGGSLEVLGGFFGKDLLKFKSGAELPLASSPTGSFSITPPFAIPGNSSRLGEMVDFTATFGHTSYLGFEAVEQVEIKWWQPDGEGGFGHVLANGRPGCTTISRAGTGQLLYTCQADFTESHRPQQTFMAFYQPSIFGIPLPVKFEVAPDSRAIVEVMEVGNVWRVQQGSSGSFTAAVSLPDGVPEPLGSVVEVGDWSWSSFSTVNEGIVSGFSCSRRVTSGGSGRGDITLSPVTGANGETRFQITFVRSGTVDQIRTCKSLDPDVPDFTQVSSFPAPEAVTIVASGRGVRDADGNLVAINFGQSLTLANGDAWSARGGLLVK